MIISRKIKMITLLVTFMAIGLIFTQKSNILSVCNFIQPTIAQVNVQLNPQEVYYKYLDTQVKSDITSYRKYLAKSLYDKTFETPDMEKYFKLSAMLTPKNVVFKSGGIKGDQAVYQATGDIPMCGGIANGTIILVKENDQWKIKSEEWKASSNDKFGGSSKTTYSVGL
jgi:hypothetical protein